MVCEHLITGATVKAINTANNEVKSTQASIDGSYTIPYLNPGTYNIDVSASGFQGLHREGIVLEVAAKVNLPLHLTLGQMTEQITVVGQQEVIDTNTADRGLVFDPIKTQEYPLNGRHARSYRGAPARCRGGGTLLLRRSSATGRENRRGCSR